MRGSSAAALVRSKSARQASTRATAQVGLQDLKLTLIGESQESRVAIFEEETFRNAQNITMEVDLVGPILKRTSDCIIIPCESSLGPRYPKWGLASDIVQQLGPELFVAVETIILERFFGMAPTGSTILMRLNEATYALFVIIAVATEHVTNKEYVYNAFRASLLEIKRHNTRVWAKQHADKDAFQIQNITCPVFPLLNGADIRLVVWQMAKAYTNALEPVASVAEIGNAIAERHRVVHGIPQLSEEGKKERFKEVVLNNLIVQRGLFSTEEVHWLLAWVGDAKAPELQEKSAIALADYIKEEKQRLPTDISRAQICEIVLQGDKYLRDLMGLAEAGKVKFAQNILPSQITELEVIGTGATATVKKAILNDVEVAYKEFHEGVDMREFNREISLMSLLTHPCLISVYGAGIKDGCKPFIVSQLASRGCLYNVLFPDNDKDRIEITFDKILLWAQETAQGMRYLHSVGIIHRDLKSLNLLLTEDWHCKVTDYGASRLIDNSNMTGNVGTAAWMAPELFNNLPYSEKADVYSYGVCLYEMVVRQHPFSDVAVFAIPRLVLKGDRPSIPKDTPKHWTRLIQSCWQDKPSKRPSFDKIVKQLDEWKNGVGI